VIPHFLKNELSTSELSRKSSDFSKGDYLAEVENLTEKISTLFASLSRMKVLNQTLQILLLGLFYFNCDADSVRLMNVLL